MVARPAIAVTALHAGPANEKVIFSHTRPPSNMSPPQTAKNWRQKGNGERASAMASKADLSLMTGRGLAPVALAARAAAISAPVARAEKPHAEQTLAAARFPAPHAKHCQAYGALI
jgi:hypothetical protein